MEKKKTFLIVGIVIAVAIIAVVIILLMGNKKDNSTSSSEQNDNTTSEKSGTKSTNTKSDFWLGNVNIPTKTKNLPNHLVEGIDGVPIDLTKLDSSYTLNYSEYNDEGQRTDFKVQSISEVKGSDWDRDYKTIDVKDNNGETVFVIVARKTCGDKEYNTYEESISDDCWLININEDKLFNKKFDKDTKDGVSELMDNIFNLLGKPTHIYVRKGDSLTMKDDGVGQLYSYIIYEYNSFKIRIELLDTYNKGHDFRMLKYYGLVYANEKVDPDFSQTLKEITNELVK